VGPVDDLLVRVWKSSRLYDWLRLKGHVAFNLPKTVSALGGLLLTFIAATHAYVATAAQGLPVYFSVYCVLIIAGCLTVAACMWLRLNPRIAQRSWFFGDLVAVFFMGIYLVTRVISVPGLVAMTGRWDYAPGTIALALAGAFVALHMSVLLHINVAYPDRQGWQD
jgi:hypothetical protein